MLLSWLVGYGVVIYMHLGCEPIAECQHGHRPELTIEMFQRSMFGVDVELTSIEVHLPSRVHERTAPVP